MAKSSLRLLFFSSSLLFQFIITSAQSSPNPLMNFCSDEGNFTTKSTYKTNLDQVLTSISTNTQINYGFYNNSFGQSSIKVNAIALCRGDKKPNTCRSCIKNASQVIRQECPNQKEAIVWYDDCMLRYSNRSIFGKMEFGPAVYMYNINNVSDVSQFTQVLTSLLDNLTTQAANGNSVRKFATGNATTSNDQTIYALMQCTPDLSQQDCSNCLANATASISKCCNGKQGGRVIATSCQLRYEIELFYEPAGEVLSASPAPAPMLPVGPAPEPVLPPQPRPPMMPPGPVPEPMLPPRQQTSSDLSPPPSGSATITGATSNIAGTFIGGVLLVLLM